MALTWGPRRAPACCSGRRWRSGGTRQARLTPFATCACTGARRCRWAASRATRSCARITAGATGPTAGARPFPSSPTRCACPPAPGPRRIAWPSATVFCGWRWRSRAGRSPRCPSWRTRPGRWCARGPSHGPRTPRARWRISPTSATLPSSIRDSWEIPTSRSSPPTRSRPRATCCITATRAPTSPTPRPCPCSRPRSASRTRASRTMRSTCPIPSWSTSAGGRTRAWSTSLPHNRCRRGAASVTA